MSSGLAGRLAEAGMSDAEAVRKQTLFEQAERALDGGKAVRTGASRRWFVPGRIEIFGKHTEYAGGRSLVRALERGLCVVAAARDDALLRVTDAATGATTRMSPSCWPGVGWSGPVATFASAGGWSRSRPGRRSSAGM